MAETRVLLWCVALTLCLASGCGAPKIKPAGTEAELVEHAFAEIPSSGANRELVKSAASRAGLKLMGSEFAAEKFQRQKVGGHNAWAAVGMNKNKEFFAVQFVEYDGKLIAVTCAKNSEMVWQHPVWSRLKKPGGE